MNKKVSLKDIALKVGVSTATVSYVLSKGKDSKVSAAVSERVKKAARELNYQPNQIAKSLKIGKTFTIGLIVADISNPFFAHIARIIEDEAKKLKYTVIFGSSDEKASKSNDLIQFLINRQVDGFIIAPSEGSQDQIKLLQDQEIPNVLIDRYFPALDTNYVVIDNVKAAFGAVDRLIKTGNQKIGLLVYATSLRHMQERRKGFEKAMKMNNIKIEKGWIKEVNFFNIKEEVHKGLDHMLKGPNPVQAILFATNTLAIHGLKYLDQLNYRIPQNISVISFDEGEAFDFYYCPLTHIKQPLQKIAATAVEILIAQIRDPSRDHKQVVIDAELVIQKSCDRT